MPGLPTLRLTGYLATMSSIIRAAIVFSAAAAAAAVPLARSASSDNGYSSIVVFGDSFSDNGQFTDSSFTLHRVIFTVCDHN